MMQTAEFQTTYEVNRNKKVAVAFCALVLLPLLGCACCCCFLFTLTATFGTPTVSTTATGGSTYSQDLTILENRFPGLNDYYSAGLPPGVVETQLESEGRYFAFETYGSGVDYILSAQCYLVSPDHQARKTGTYLYVNDDKQLRHLYAATCS